MYPIILHGTEIGLGIVRSLGMRNIKSILIYSNRDEFARASKNVLTTYRCPPWSDYKAVKNFLLGLNGRHKGSLLVPTGDPQVEMLAKYKKELSESYIVPVPDYEIAKTYLDKKNTYKAAKKAGISFPLTFYPTSKKEAIEAAKEMQFPIMIKPREIHKFVPIFQAKLFIVDNETELDKQLSLCFEHNVKLMITEIIPGPDANLFEYDFYVDKSGEFIAGLSQVKVRQHPPNFGFGRVLKTTVNKKVEELSKSFVKQIPGFFGPGQLEFKYDERDQKYKLIEMNGRMTFQNELYAKAGINFAYLFYQDWVKHKAVKINGYIENLYWIHLLPDLMDSIFRYKEENYSLRDYVKPYFKKPMFGIESLTDIKPTVLYWSWRFKKLGDIIKQRLLQS